MRPGPPRQAPESPLPPSGGISVRAFLLQVPVLPFFRVPAPPPAKLPPLSEALTQAPGAGTAQISEASLAPPRSAPQASAPGTAPWAGSASRGQSETEPDPRQHPPADPAPLAPSETARAGQGASWSGPWPPSARWPGAAGTCKDGPSPSPSPPLKELTVQWGRPTSSDGGSGDREESDTPAFPTGLGRSVQSQGGPRHTHTHEEGRSPRKQSLGSP